MTTAGDTAIDRAGAAPFVSRGGTAAELVAAVDWSAHPLGPQAGWPPALAAMLRFILTSPESMYIVWGPQRTFFFNDAYAPLLGPRVAQAMGAGFRDLWADAWPAIDTMVARALAGEGSEFEDFHIPMARYGEAEDTWWSFSFSPIYDDAGAVAGMLCLTNEVTARILAQRAEQEAEARNRQILDSATDFAIVSTDPRGRITQWNEGATRTLGWEKAEMIGEPLDRIFTPEDIAAGRPAHEMTMALETGAGRDERWHVRRNGERFWADGQVTVLRDEAGAANGFVKVLRDRTDKRLVEEELRALNATLEDHVAREVDARIRTEEALRQSQKVEAIGQLTGGVAHDFNNLLTVIKGSVDLLRRPDLTEEKRRRYTDAISDTADRAVKLTSQLLAFARRQALKPVVFDAGENVLALRDMLHSLTGSQIEVTVEPGGDPCLVDADPSQFDTALVNMAVNARDAMAGRGTIRITLGAVSGMPAVRSHPAVAGEFVAVAIRDTGCGIPADRIDKIFEPFFTTKDVGKGTGLGLSQVFGFAKQSGGDVMVESVEGEGSTFTIYLPRAAARAAEAEPAAVAGVPAKSACVLVVEDNPDVGAFAVQALRELGHHTVLAADGAAALAELEKDAGRFDIVFSDVVMPGMTGIELGESVRQLYPGLPVILTSGYSSVLAKHGSYGFELLHKPYSIDQLSAVLQRGAARLQREPD
ncbi:PAS domain S-box protein [Sphingomonas profundi]|uniref:PAS domain S-box protein n=1 Tax=Alterirhizorhabdus profundi TaxID=2681549 RepID=UPI0012E7A9CA|nr:PAS domain S-box protein [Sphingomonas profundi]